MESQLQTIEVYASKGMSQRRYVQMGGRKVYGNDEPGKAVMQAEKTPFQLHCLGRAISLKRPPWYFICDTIATTFHVPVTHRETLAFILLTSAGPLIEGILSIKGLWDEAVSDIDDVDEDEEIEDEDEERPDAKNDDTGVVDIDDDSDDCLFVSTRPRPPAEKSTEDEDLSDDPETGSTPSATPKLSRPPRPRQTYSFGGRRLVSTQTRRDRKARKEEAAIAMVIDAAGDYDTDTVHVYGSRRQTSTNIAHLAGLAFEETKSLKDFPGQDDRTRYHGELFVRELLNTIFQCTDDAWTSPMRVRQDLEKTEEMETPEGKSTFTVIGTNPVAIITEWLEERGYDAKTAKDKYPLEYHIFVKVTEGDFDEPFTFSNQEFELVCSICLPCLATTNILRRSRTGARMSSTSC